jgi:hypothetical protein
VELAISRIDRRVVPQHVLQHVKVAVERRPMQRRAAVLRQRRHWKAAAEHCYDSRDVVVTGRVGDLPQRFAGRTLDDLRIDR